MTTLEDISKMTKAEELQLMEQLLVLRLTEKLKSRNANPSTLSVALKFITAHETGARYLPPPAGLDHLRELAEKWAKDLPPMDSEDYLGTDEIADDGAR